MTVFKKSMPGMHNPWVMWLLGEALPIKMVATRRANWSLALSKRAKFIVVGTPRVVCPISPSNQPTHGCSWHKRLKSQCAIVLLPLSGGPITMIVPVNCSVFISFHWFGTSKSEGIIKAFRPLSYHPNRFV